MSGADLINLVYVSAARGILDEGAMAELLAQSRRNNARIGITGVLLHAAGNFMQALEGEESAVAALFERIRSDPRHHLVKEMVRVPIAVRQFGEWSMALRTLNDLPPDARAGCKALLEARFEPGPGEGDWPGLVRRLLESFRTSMG